MNRTPITKLLSILALLFILALPIAAQDVTTVPTTTDLSPLSIVGTTEAGSPIYAIPIPQPVVTPLPPMSTSEPSGTTQFVIGGLSLVILVLVVAILVLVFMTLRSRAAAGDQQAAQWLRMLEVTQKTFAPRETVNARIAEWEKGAALTPSLIDDAMVWMVKNGYQFIAPAAASTTVNVSNGIPADAAPPPVSVTRTLTDPGDGNWPQSGR